MKLVFNQPTIMEMVYSCAMTTCIIIIIIMEEDAPLKGNELPKTGISSKNIRQVSSTNRSRGSKIEAILKLRCSGN